MRGELVGLKHRQSGVWGTLAGISETAEIFVPSEHLPPDGLLEGHHVEARMKLRQKPDESAYYFAVIEAVRVLEDPGPIEEKLLLGLECLEQDELIDQDTWRRFMRREIEPDQPWAVDLPEISRAIVLSSESADGWKDFKKRLGSDFDPSVISLQKIRLGGQGLVEDLPAALGQIGPEDADLVFVVRGGGNWASLRDFDDVEVARAIAEARVPVATAVGHVGNVGLSDVVAGWAFATPTTAADALQRKLRSQRHGSKSGQKKSWGKGSTHVAARSIEQESLQAQLREVQEDLAEARRTSLASRELTYQLDHARVLADQAAGKAWLALARERVRFRARWHAVAGAVAGCLLLGLAFFGGAWVAIGAASAVASWAYAAYGWSGPRRAERPVSKRGSHRLPASRQEWEMRIAQARTPRALRPLTSPPPPHAMGPLPAASPRPTGMGFLGHR